MERRVDLRGVPPSRVQTAAFYEVRDLRAGETLVIRTLGDPALMMASLDLQLRDALAWVAEQGPDGDWQTRVALRAETPSAGITDALTRDHRRLDELFARALRCVNGEDLRGAGRLIAAFAAGLRRHVECENTLLAPVLPRPAASDGTSHVAIMLREHEEILRQLQEVEALFATEPLPEAWEVEPFVAILSGTLAKHEYREETNLFPPWDAALAAVPEAERALLERRVAETLAGPDGA